MRTLIFLLCQLLLGSLYGQRIKPQLANSNWPIFHANTAATASVSGVASGVPSTFQTVESLKPFRRGKPAVSPWTVMGEPYADGSQPVYTTPNNGVAKYLIKNNQLQPVHFLKLDRKLFDFDWGILVLKDNRIIVTEQKRERFVILEDKRANAPLEIVDYIDVPASEYGELTAHFSLAPDGTLISLTDNSELIAIDMVAKRIIARKALGATSGLSFHNSFPIDRNGRIYLNTQREMTAYDWNGAAFTQAWTASYDMRGPSCENYNEDTRPLREAINVAQGKECTGSGTTPSLIGAANGVVVIVDGHAPQNNLVAFWRGDVPTNWQPLPDPNRAGQLLDRRVAGVFPLPHSSPSGKGYTAENSPAVLGNAVIIAQWAGFQPEGQFPRGVQRVDWKPGKRAFELAWANPAAHFNGVPTITGSNGSYQTYGMGLLNGRYVYQTLDFATGNFTAQLDLGTDAAVLDQGNNHAVANDGSVVYSGKTRMVRIR